MTFVVPAVLGGLALTVMALVSYRASRRSQRSEERQAPGPRILVHSINDDRCTGCDACVAVCPTNVLDLVNNKSRVLRFQDCIQCEACMWACPTESLVMHPEGTTPPPVSLPDLDEYFQTRVPGQYLIGEVAGKPLIKNGANLGRAVVEHMITEGLRPARQASAGLFDVVIVGSGPGGLSAALTCHQRGLSYIVLEKESIISSTVSRYPKGKLIMAEPYDVPNLSLLPVYDSSKEELVPLWQEMITGLGINVALREAVQSANRESDGTFTVKSMAKTYRGQRLVLATGTRGKPRMLGVPGEDLSKVESLLEDPTRHRGQAVCVVGGGDSALEAAMALSDAGAKVILSYRGASFHRAQPRNRQSIEQYAQSLRIKVKFQSEIVEFGRDSVTLQMVDGMQKRYPNQASFVLIGSDPPVRWLAALGIHYVERHHMAPGPRSDQLVQRLVPNAEECPHDPEDAAALVLGRRPRQRNVQRQRPEEPVRRERRGLIRAASELIGLRESSVEIGEGVPLAQHASGRRHSGNGRRDQLPPGERTRLLRMLRDEGGRRADEDSQLYVVEKPDRRRRASSVQGSPPPDRYPPPPPVASREQPRQAVIVGLAKATARGPGSGSSSSRTAPRRPPPSEEFARPLQAADFEKTHNLDIGEIDEIDDSLYEADPTHQVRLSSDRDTPMPYTGEEAGIHEASTRVVDADGLFGGESPRSMSEIDFDFE